MGTFLVGKKQQYNNSNNDLFSEGGLEKRNPARTIDTPAVGGLRRHSAILKKVYNSLSSINIDNYTKAHLENSAEYIESILDAKITLN